MSTIADFKTKGHAKWITSEEVCSPYMRGSGKKLNWMRKYSENLLADDYINLPKKHSFHMKDSYDDSKPIEFDLFAIS